MKKVQNVGIKSAFTPKKIISFSMYTVRQLLKNSFDIS